MIIIENSISVKLNFGLEQLDPCLGDTGTKNSWKLGQVFPSLGLKYLSSFYIDYGFWDIEKWTTVSQSVNFSLFFDVPNLKCNFFQNVLSFLWSIWLKFLRKVSIFPRDLQPVTNDSQFRTLLCYENSGHLYQRSNRIHESLMKIVN